MKLALQDLHLVNSAGDVVLEKAQQVLVRNKNNLGLFANQEELDLAHPVPVHGEFAYLSDTDEMVIRFGDTWFSRKAELAVAEQQEAQRLKALERERKLEVSAGVGILFADVLMIGE